MTKAVLNVEICFINAVLSLCENGHFFQKFSVKSPLPPNTIKVSIFECKTMLNSLAKGAECAIFCCLDENLENGKFFSGMIIILNLIFLTIL